MICSERIAISMTYLKLNVGTPRKMPEKWKIDDSGLFDRFSFDLEQSFSFFFYWD